MRRTTYQQGELDGQRQHGIYGTAEAIGRGRFLHSLVESVLADLMECEVTNQIGADLHEHNGDRQAYRNGYRGCILHSRLGTLELQVPKLRRGTYFPSFLERRARVVYAPGLPVLRGLSARIRIVGGAVQVSFATEEAATEQLIRDHARQLESGLGAAGLNLATLSVSHEETSR